MSWQAITTAYIQERLSGPEWSTFTTVVLAPGQTTDALIADAINFTTEKVRMYVGSCPRNALGPAGMIPTELMDEALAILRKRIAARLPRMAKFFDATREKEYDAAIRLLERVADGRQRIIPPEPGTDAPGDEQPGNPIAQTVRRGRQQQTDRTLSGL